MASRTTFRMAMAAGSIIAAAPSAAHAQRASFEELQTFSAVLNHVRLNYVDSVSYTPLVRAAIAGALSSLDPHSRYVRLEAGNIVADVARGITASVGLVLDDAENGVIVTAVGPGSPAERAGVLALDRVVAVQDTSTAGLGSTDIEAALAGALESSVRITLERGSVAAPQRVTVRLKRAKYTWPAVSASTMLDSITGYVRFDEFTEGSGSEVEKAVKAVQKTGARQLVLDMRGNPGGDVREAVAIASLFLPEGSLVFSSDGRASGADARFSTSRNGPFVKLPLIVLVDGNSASASEAVAAALQDHDRALLVGHRTFGKALMQAYHVLPAGDGLWLTVARIVSPSGRIIQRNYRDLTSGQYRALAGSAGQAGSHRSAAGRPLDAAGGVAPDIEMPARPVMPPWVTIALDSAIDQQVIRDAIASLPAGVTAETWASMSDTWAAALAEPFIAQVNTRIAPVAPEPAVRAYLARFLAVRLAESHWGNAAAARFRAVTDSEIAAARTRFASLPALLKP